MKSTEHVLVLPAPETVQVVEENVPVSPDWAKVAVPVGADFVPFASLSVTVAVQVVACPIKTPLGEHPIEDVVARLVTERVVVPTL